MPDLTFTIGVCLQTNTIGTNVANFTVPTKCLEFTVIADEDSEVPFAKRTDFISDTLIFRGEATPGTANGTNSWRIWRIVIAGDDDVVLTWADGNANFDNVWDDRLTLGYS